MHFALYLYARPESWQHFFTDANRNHGQRIVVRSYVVDKFRVLKHFFEDFWIVRKRFENNLALLTAES